MISEIILITDSDLPEPDLAKPDLAGFRSDAASTETSASEPCTEVKEIGGREGLDPTRYGDWEKNGRCIDF